MKKTYRIEFTINNSSSEAKDILEPFKNSKKFKSWLTRSLLGFYAESYNLRDVNPMNSLKITVVEVKNDA